MALGFSAAGGENSDIMPIIKYDARAGRFTRVDRSNATGQWEAEATEITNCFSAVFDLENIEVGWLDFSGSRPSFHLAKIGEDFGPRPSKTHKEGFRLMLKLGKEAGGDIREFCSAANVVKGSIDALHDQYRAHADGKLPVVKLKSTKPVVSGSGTTKSTNYAPVFEVTGWVARPADLIFKPKAMSNGDARPAAATGPASTGSTTYTPAGTTTANAGSTTVDNAEDFG